MNITETIMHGVPVTAIAGRMDTLSATECEQALAQRLGDGRRMLVVDLGGVDYISSTGIRAILVTQKKAAEAGIGMALAQPSEHVLQVFEIARLTAMLAPYPSVEAAIAALSK